MKQIITFVNYRSYEVEGEDADKCYAKAEALLYKDCSTPICDFLEYKFYEEETIEEE